MVPHDESDNILYQYSPASEAEVRDFGHHMNPPREPKTASEQIAWKCRYCGSKGPFDADGCKCREAV